MRLQLKPVSFGTIVATVLATMLVSTPAMAKKKKKPKVELTKCTTNFGTVAVVDGDTQGWTKYGLGSPRELIAALARESGCFTIHNAASGKPAQFLMNVIAGDKEEVDRGVSMAKTVVAEGMLRSGAAGALLTKVPLGGSLFKAFGGFGGKKKTVAAGIRMISPATGQTVLAGSGQVKKSTLSFKGNSGFSMGAQASGYARNKNGKMLTEAFVIAFNSVSSQGSVLSSVATPPAAAPESAGTKAAVDTKMYTTADKTSAVLRSLRAGTVLKPTGERNGLFVEVNDNFGTKGWVSVEDLQ